MIQCNCIATAGACHAGNRGGSNRELLAIAKNGLSGIKREVGRNQLQKMKNSRDENQAACISEDGLRPSILNGSVCEMTDALCKA